MNSLIHWSFGGGRIWCQSLHQLFLSFTPQFKCNLLSWKVLERGQVCHPSPMTWPMWRLVGPPAEILGNEVKVAGEGVSLLSNDKGITPIKNVSISDLEEHNTPISLSSTYGSTSETPIDLSTDVTTSLLSKGSLLLETQLTLMFLSRCWRRPLR